MALVGWFQKTIVDGSSRTVHSSEMACPWARAVVCFVSVCRCYGTMAVAGSPPTVWLEGTSLCMSMWLQHAPAVVTKSSHCLAQTFGLLSNSVRAAPEQLLQSDIRPSDLRREAISGRPNMGIFLPDWGAPLPKLLERGQRPNSGRPSRRVNPDSSRTENGGWDVLGWKTAFPTLHLQPCSSSEGWGAGCYRVSEQHEVLQLQQNSRSRSAAPGRPLKHQTTLQCKHPG